MTTEERLKLIDAMLQESTAKLSKLCVELQYAMRDVENMRNEMSEIRELSNRLTKLETQQSVLKWIVGLLLPASITSGAAASWFANMFHNGGGQ